MRFTRIKRQFLLLCLCFVFSCLVSVFLWPRFNPRDLSIYSGNERSKVVILMWSKYYQVKGDKLMSLINRGKDYDARCCDEVEITLDRGKLENATAIVIYHYFGNLKMSDLPKTRRHDQVWVLFMKENPTMSPALKPFNKLFNWTMSYREDSDVFAPYGEYLPLDNETNSIQVNDVPLDAFIARKTELLAGVISHCHTSGKREEFIKQLRVEGNMKVDIFGKCGKRICNRLNATCDHNKWWTELAAKYKFYFTSENAFCTDYISEKLWRTLQIGMVPLVYGAGNYSRFAPRNSYIDVRAFKSVKDVGAYLKKLDEDEIKYKRYFEWRKRYQVRISECWQGWCDLCKKVTDFQKKLDENNNPFMLENLSRTIDDLEGWWLHKTGGKKHACENPPFKYKIRKTTKKSRKVTKPI